jgi:hypothetical protein
MKGKINPAGILMIWRVNEYKKQYCPLSGGDLFCGDTCPLFREPWLDKATENTVLKICYREIVLKEFEDEREKP